MWDSVGSGWTDNVHFDERVGVTVGVHGSQVSAADHAHNQPALLAVVRQRHQDATPLLRVVPLVELPHTHAHTGGHLFYCTHLHPVITFTARSTPEIIGWLSSFLLMEDNVCTKVKHLPVCHYATGIYVKTTPRGHLSSDVGQRVRVMQCVANVCNVFLVTAFCQQYSFFFYFYLHRLRH